MPRPIQKRKIGYFPENYCFTPDVLSNDGACEVCLTHDELESIRLSDVNDLKQTQASVLMGISRGTFQRIIGRARRKIADALVYGRAIRITGGTYKLNDCNAHCTQCGHIWHAPCDILFYENEGKCPHCGSFDIGCDNSQGTCGLGDTRHATMLHYGQTAMHNINTPSSETQKDRLTNIINHMDKNAKKRFVTSQKVALHKQLETLNELEDMYHI